MISVSAEIYEVLSLAARYLFALLGVLIVFRSFLWLLEDRREKHSRLRHLPDAGMIGELVVLSGSRDCPVDSFLPVPREGVLGSVRSCDLVVPCPGVRPRHLDFSWQDGVGLLLRPRSGCEALADSVPLTCRTHPEAAPLRHGSYLQVGEAIFRLRVFAGLDSAAGFQDVPQPAPAESGQVPPPMQPVPGQVFFGQPERMPADPGYTAPVPPVPEQVVPSQTLSGKPYTETVSPADPDRKPRRSRRADRWKEDWSE